MKTNKLFGFTMAVGVFCAAGLTAYAGPITGSTTTSFGDLAGSAPGANYGGSGIPTTDSEISTTIVSGDGATTGILEDLNVTPRGVNGQTAGNNANANNATYYVTLGSGTWNFDYYIGLTGGGTLLGNLDTLSYLITITDGVHTTSFNPGLVGVDGTSTIQNSENLGFSFLSALGYNPEANDTYTITEDVLSGNTVVAADTINIVQGSGSTSSVPDSAATIGLLGASVAGMICFKRVIAVKTSVSSLLN
jgi:hypothetical protein